MVAYLDSSALIRYVFQQPNYLDLRAYSLVASELTHVECMRTLDRLRVSGAADEHTLALRRGALVALLESVDLVAISRRVLTMAAGPMPTMLATLDAIHLATALFLREELGETMGMLTHDRELARAAQVYDFKVLGAVPGA